MVENTEKPHGNQWSLLVTENEAHPFDCKEEDWSSIRILSCNYLSWLEKLMLFIYDLIIIYNGLNYFNYFTYIYFHYFIVTDHCHVRRFCERTIENFARIFMRTWAQAKHLGAIRRTATSGSLPYLPLRVKQFAT